MKAYQYIKRHQNLFQYTSGRWIYNDKTIHSERERIFNIAGLKRLAAECINQNEEDVVGFRKLAEGGFNRTFLLTLRNGFQMSLEPKSLLVASEVATMDFLRLHGIPTPKDIWIVKLEAQLFPLQFPSCGCIYYSKDLQRETNRVVIPAQEQFCVGPDTSLGLWYGRRLQLDVDRGPYDQAAALKAGASKEIAYLRQFGQPLRREIFDYERLSHLEHIESLQKYLQIAPLYAISRWIPESLQNYGDSVSESLQRPSLPEDFEELSLEEQSTELELFRRRQLHYFYVKETEKTNTTHYHALTDGLSALRRKLDNATLQADLVLASRNWTKLTRSASAQRNEPIPCPIEYTEDKERLVLADDWVFDDFDEEEYK
ncbi:hypothetical protein ASPZODRAFT_153342 [Penicilliopsis zonata CBS 506.65]|uniref:Aminoglycoside phosphotransferase domain-containing protein n=1 Tax=Penicilliopsis zonata CBS 506.65 TaxID=1073090 RepID=A0A1L9SD30_9EURO|nr:hypothetical protein ASPZODRAFT_153342 [Penicilliopsis zonata CBS 506.65]OJJ45032.1 hypothetical protein ASPZODRAFT_153342 [Penicilliopsis zonata CBS 506.65]